MNLTCFFLLMPGRTIKTKFLSSSYEACKFIV
uniref:Uncharacterized protein n=1 Tax=Rhizophora mucronata TaxID=61149 RepID=A0A2P2J9X5_RHIMU